MSQEQEKNKFQQPGRVKVIQGSILSPHNAGLRFILNVTNLAGKMDGPMYPIFDKKWPKVKQEVRGSYATKTGAYKLGALACNTAVQSDTWVLSMLCQDENLNNDEAALKKCLKEICKLAKSEKSTVHVSTILVEAVPDMKELLNSELVENGVSVFFYEEPGT